MARRISAPRGEVPFLHEKQIEAEAELVLAECADKFGSITVPPIPIEQIAEVLLQLALEFKHRKALFPFADVHGAIWFTEGRIGIEQRLAPQANPSRRGRYHFTLAHEVGHWRLHRAHYQQNPAERRLFDDGTPQAGRHLPVQRTKKASGMAGRQLRGLPADVARRRKPKRRNRQCHSFLTPFRAS